MIKLSIFAALTFSTIQLNPRHYYQRHGVSQNECCISSGGKLCGKVIKQCCDAQGCLKKWYGEYCKRQSFTPQCKPCSEQCVALGGTVCQVSVSFQTFKCCPEELCISPNNGSIIDKAFNKLVDKTMEKVTPDFLLSPFTTEDKKEDKKNKEDEHLQRNLESKINSEHHDAAFLDKLLNKIAGPRSKCEGTPIALPKNCMKDSRITLLGARLI